MRMAALAADIRSALVVLRRQWRLSVAAAACVAIGIAATGAVVTLIDVTVFEPLSFRDAERLVRVWNERLADGTRADLSWGGYTDVTGLESLERLEATARARLIYLTDEGSRRVDGEAVTPGYFELLGVEAFAGRLFTAQEYLDGADPVILLSHAAWGAMYQYDPAAVGSLLRTNTQNYRNPQLYTIVGILPPAFVGTAEADFPDLEFWIPAYQYIAPAARALRAGRLVQTVGKLADGVTLQQAREELAPLSQELGLSYPRERQDVTHRVEYFGDNWREEFQRGNGMLLTAAGMLLLVAAANVSGLLLARALDRRHEFAIRGALGATRAGRFLVVAEIALTVVLVVCSALLLRSYATLGGADLGFRTERFLRMGLFVDVAEVPDNAGLPAFYDRLRDTLRGAPEVERAALVHPTAPNEEPFQAQVRFAGMPEEQLPDGIASSFYNVGPDFFATLEIPVIAGRGIEPGDTVDQPPVVVVSRSLAERMGGIERATGMVLQLGGRELRVVGVVEDTAMGGPVGDQRFDLQFYQFIYQVRPRLVSMSLITRGEPLAAVPDLRRRLTQLAPTSAIDIVDDVGAAIAWTYRRERFFVLLVGAFTAAALSLAAVGLYAILAHQVSRATMEIGVRKSFGATASAIRGLTLRRGLSVAGVGLLLGLGLSLLAARSLRGLLYGVPSFDLTAYTAAALVILVVAALAALVPARRAAAIEPTEALRSFE